LELLLPLVAGARAILGDPRSGLPESGTVVMNATPSAWCRLLDEGWTPAEGTSLLASGEPLALGLAERLELAGAEIWSAFGARELGVWSALGRASGDLAEAVAGATIRLLDGYGRAVPMGVPGEICVGGACLPLAYGGPAPRRERFVPDPFSPGARLFRAGELGRLLPDGRIELLGATADLEGEARDLAEIETALRRVPGILTVAACDREPERGSRVAYLNVDPDRPFEAAAVRSFLAGRLPGVMPPSELILLDSFPLLADGRTDRSALPSPDEVTVGRQETAAPPRTALELQLVQIWERLFDRRPIGVTDSFFDLGGHSLLAARLAAEIRAHFGREVQIARLLQEPTIRRLARALEEKVQAETWSPLVPLQPRGSHPPFFCVHPAGGSALRYVALAYQLGTDYPVYGLQARGHETGQKPFDRIEEMAAFYCQAIASVRPRGPYLLGGWSFGGLVAFEMARQFLEQGEEVPLIALFDSAAGNVAWDRYQGPVPDQAEQLARVLGDELAVPVDELRRFENADEQAEHIVRQAQKRGVLPADYDVGQARRYIATLEAHGQAMRAYTPRPFPGRVVQLCATEGLITALGDPRLGWEELALGGVEVHMIPGRHQDLFRPPAVQLVGELLRSGHMSDR
jgi:thioesterase domain-containing protein/acyl carrier protein